LCTCLAELANERRSLGVLGRDGTGARIAKCETPTSSPCASAAAGTLFWRDIAGNTLAESDLSGNITKEYIYFAGQRTAWVDASSGDVYYYYTDQIGSVRRITTQTGTPCYSADFTPYGQEIYDGATSCTQNYKFAGYERDSETGLDYAHARYYNSRLGRFTSPDPLGGGIGNPQSLNRYSYVRNNPINLTDPSGMHDPGGWDDDNCTVNEADSDCGYLFGVGVGAGYAGLLFPGAGLTDDYGGYLFQFSLGAQDELGENTLNFGYFDADTAIYYGFPYELYANSNLTFDQLLDIVSSYNMSYIDDKTIACVAQVESSGNPNAASDASSSIGLMQMNQGAVTTVYNWYSDSTVFSGFTSASDLYSQQTTASVSIMSGSAYLQMIAFDYPSWSYGMPDALGYYYSGPSSSAPSAAYQDKVMGCVKDH
jgi:RHS repeat-associated protein